jgi:hypothetical protein
MDDDYEYGYQNGDQADAGVKHVEMMNMMSIWKTCMYEGCGKKWTSLRSS